MEILLESELKKVSSIQFLKKTGRELCGLSYMLWGRQFMRSSLPKSHIMNFKTGWSVGFESVTIQALQTVMSRVGWSNYGSKRAFTQMSMRSNLEKLFLNAGRAGSTPQKRWHKVFKMRWVRSSFLIQLSYLTN